MYDITTVRKMKTLEVHAPEAMKAFVAFDKAALAGGAIPGKYKELMALAVTFTTQCPYCIELHATKARELGASDTEVAETVLIAAALRADAAITTVGSLRRRLLAALRAGAAIIHGTHAMKGI